MTIVEFVTARLDEDEAVARAATPGPWEWTVKEAGLAGGSEGPILVTVKKLPPYADGSVSPEADIITGWGHDYWGLNVEPGDMAHISRFDPARVLADIAAKREIVEYAATSDSAETMDHPGVMFPHYRLMPVLKHLASVYADHPDFNPDWRADHG